jgi:hypothetical protein
VGQVVVKLNADVESILGHLERFTRKLSESLTASWGLAWADVNIMEVQTA